MEGNSDVTSLLFPQAGSGCLPNTLRCSDWDVAKQPRHHCCCSASGTQVGAYVDLTLKEQQCWGVEGGLHGKILDWAEAQGARPYLNHHRHQTEGLSRHTGSVLVAKSLLFFFSSRLCFLAAAPCFYIINSRLHLLLMPNVMQNTKWTAVLTGGLYCGCKHMNTWTLNSPKCNQDFKY